jgi:hypothetical protein
VILKICAALSGIFAVATLLMLAMDAPRSLVDITVTASFAFALPLIFNAFRQVFRLLR